MMTKLFEDLYELEKARTSGELFDVNYQIWASVEKFKEILEKNNIDLKEASTDFLIFLIGELFLDKSKIMIDTLVPDEIDKPLKKEE